MKKFNKSNIFAIVFFGSVWGILEATLGYALHFIPTFVAGLIMFPIAAGLLVRAAKVIGSRQAIIYVGLVAATIKAIGFFMPGLSLFKTLNPMVAIVMEALLVMAVYPYLIKLDMKSISIGALISGIGWRVLFVAYMFGQYAVTGFMAKYLNSVSAVMSFIVLSGALSAVLVVGSLQVEKHFSHRFVQWIGKPVVAIMSMIVAFGVTYLV